MHASPLEFLAQQMGNVVKYDTEGNPSIFVPFTKVRSKDLDPSLPDRTHPAFIVNGVELDRILIGKYMGGEIAPNGTLYSLPNIAPKVSTGADTLEARVKQFAGASPMTIAMHGLILLLAKKNGWVPKGNTYYSVDHRDSTPWTVGSAATVGIKRALYGWEYECLIAHTMATELKPDIAPNHWKRRKFVGGTTPPGERHLDNGRGYNTMTGSGPASWNLDGTPESMTDVVGGAMENLPGYRIFDGELQIFANNDAAHPQADNTAASAAWRAILPNASNDGHTLVTPGTAGTLKWDKVGSAPVLDTQISTRSIDSESMSIAFKSLTANATRLPHVPAILKELGIFPIAGDATAGTVYYRNHLATEYYPRRGGGWYNASNAGLGCIYGYNSRGYAYAYYGIRPAFVEL